MLCLFCKHGIYRDMLEIAVLLLVLVITISVLSGLYLVFVLTKELKGITITINHTKEAPVSSPNIITPAQEDTPNLLDFEPDLSKPVTLKYEKQ